MSDIIKLLEKMGAEANLTDQELVVNANSKDAAQAILTKDVKTLESLLNTRGDVYCALIPAEDEDNKEQDDQKKDTESLTKVVNW